MLYLAAAGAMVAAVAGNVRKDNVVAALVAGFVGGANLGLALVRLLGGSA